MQKNIITKYGPHTRRQKMRRGDMYEEKYIMYYIMYYIVYDITECMQFQK